METAEIRRRFLDHFTARDHELVPSAPLVLDDPTLLFVNAGMVPFKPYFLGEQTPPWPRATSVQKCVRTIDIEEVGKTTRHATFFQMAGNFSFGDYFKEGAIRYAWELFTRPVADGGYGLDESRLWVSVYRDDDESVRLWQQVAGLPEHRIARLGKKDNYWDMGVPGPCGPDSEIFYDRGPEYGAEGGPGTDDGDDRYIELWNLVFMQYLRGEGIGKDDYEILGDLPAQNVDTGMGLERMGYILQGVGNLYEIDQVFPVIGRAAELAGTRYGADGEGDVRLRVVGDHVRSGLMLMADGVAPGNEGRGYVLRRLLRRAVRSMRLLGVDEPVLPELLPLSRDLMAASYPEVATDFGRISEMAYAEELAFRRTLAAGTTILDTAVAKTKAAGGSTLPGDRAFALHDTYGFPIDLTLEMAAEQGLEVDREGFTRLMQEQRQRAKADARAKKTGATATGPYRELAETLDRPVEFTGYDEVVSGGTVRGLLRGEEVVPAAGAGEEVAVVLDRTPFYAEGGGQLADRGVIEVDGARAEVLDVQQPVDGLVVHRVKVLDGELRTGAEAVGRVDVDRRRSISRSHTATHMVHKAIRESIGETATQAGSENSPGRFRFDFAAAAQVPASVLRDVEDRVNALVGDDLAVHAEVMGLEEARKSGVMALFGEKYGDEVRVVSVGDWARELCGGTHAQRSGQLGLVKLLGESSIGSGVRRVEALVGVDAYRYLAREHVLVAQLSEALKAPPAELPERVAGIVERLRAAEKELDRLRAGAVLAAAAGLAAGAEDVEGLAYVATRAPDGTSADDLRTLVLDVRGRLGEQPGRAGAVVAAAAAGPGGRPLVVVATDEGARARGLRAGALVRTAAGVLGGGGGGKDDVAQGGGADAASIGAALDAVREAVRAAPATGGS